MQRLIFFLHLAVSVLLVGCAIRPSPVTVEDVRPEDAIDQQAEMARAAGGLVVVRKASSLTLSMAQDRALRRARQGLSELVLARVNTLQEEFLKVSSGSDTETVKAWFDGVTHYLEQLILGGSQASAEETLVDAGLATVWILMVEDPAMIVQSLEIRGAGNRQLYERIRASQPYRTLLMEAEQFAAYRMEQARPPL